LSIHKVLEGRTVEDLGHGLLGLRPNLQENAIAIKWTFVLGMACDARDRLEGALKEPDDLAQREILWRPGQAVAARSATARVYEAGLFQLVQDHLKESVWNGLGFRNVDRPDGPTSVTKGQFEDSP
jgi:hypothetical protein